jgi:DNA invertase Pin-like site-specific DNA recombinase
LKRNGKQCLKQPSDVDGPVHWQQDEGCSGKQVNQELRRALDDLAAGRAEALVVSKMDRLARSVAHASDIVEAAKTQGWNLVVLDLGVDLATPQGRAMAHMLAVFAELERELIGQRTREALAAAKRRGVRLGAPILASPSVGAGS